MSKNHHGDTLVKLASSKDADLLCIIPLKVLTELSIHAREEVIEVETKKSWINDITNYIKHDRLLEDRDYARRIKLHFVKYLIIDGKLYKRGYLTTLLWC